jgi:hypothetical protein
LNSYGYEVCDIEADKEGKTLFRLDVTEPVPEFNGAATLSVRGGYNDVYVNTTSLGRTRFFETTDYYTEAVYNPEAFFVYSSQYCDVFCEREYWQNGIDNTHVAMIAGEFDEKIRPLMLENYGDYIGYEKNGKIAILLQNIRDPYYHNKGNSYVGGYFSTNYLYTEVGDPLPLIVIDIDPLMTIYEQVTENGVSIKKPVGYDVTKGFSTLVHEFQHLVNFSDYVFGYYNATQRSPNELWLNEMRSMCAEHMLYGCLANRVQYFNGKTLSGKPITYSDGTLINEYIKTGSVLN